MTEAAAPPSKMQSWSRRLRDTACAYPDVIAIAVYAALALMATVAAYFSIFTQFMSYDDEGTLLTTVKAFAEGDALYRDVYSAYGPFYYELFGGFFALSGLDVTTNASRTIVVVVWVGTSLLFGLAAQRLAGRLAVGAAGMIVAFATLNVLVNEPMHPQGLCVLLLATFVLLAVSMPSSQRPRWLGAGAGVVLAALVLTKVNVGIFAIAAAVLAAIWTAAPLHRRGWLRLPVIGAFLAMPLLVMARDLELAWVRELLLLEVLAICAILVAARPLQPRPGDPEARLMPWLLAAAAGLLAAFVAILGVAVLTGPSLSDIYAGVVTEAIRVRDILLLPFQFPSVALDWGIAAVAGAALVSFLRREELAPTRLWPGLLRAAAGVTILFAVARVAPLGLDPSAANPDVLPMALAWVAAIPVAGAREAAEKRFLRLLLPALAVSWTLQVYPVAGSQIGISAVAFVPVAALCLGDAFKELQSWAAARGTSAPQRLGVVATVLGAAVAGMLALHAIILPMASNSLLYRDQAELPLPGADLLHLPAPTVDTYTGVVDLLHRYRCTGLVGYPSTNSLYLWAGIEAPAPQLPNAWMDAFGRSRQQRVVDQMRSSPRPCVVRSEERAGMYLQGAAPDDLPLVRYVFEDFSKVAQVGDFEVLLPKGRVTDQASGLR